MKKAILRKKAILSLLEKKWRGVTLAKKSQSLRGQAGIKEIFIKTITMVVLGRTRILGLGSIKDMVTLSQSVQI